MYWLRSVWKASFDSSKSRMSSPISIPCPNFLMDYKHLAKLVLYAALSKESKRIAERITKRRAASVD